MGFMAILSCTQHIITAEIMLSEISHKDEYIKQLRQCCYMNRFETDIAKLSYFQVEG